MVKLIIDKNKFKDPFYINLPVRYKFFWDYLLCECNEMGLIEVDPNKFENALTYKIDINTAKSLLKDKIIDLGKYWFLRTYINDQYGSLDPVRHQRIIDAITELKLLEYVKIKNIKQKKEFVPPEFDEVLKYFLEKKLTAENAKIFFDYYSPSWQDKFGNQVLNWKGKMKIWNFRNSKESFIKAQGEGQKTIYEKLRDQKV